MPNRFHSHSALNGRTIRDSRGNFLDARWHNRRANAL
jgi:hypothetical protein